MARMTQAERNAANALAREQADAAKALEYPNAKMTMLARASKEDMKVTVNQVSVDTFEFVVEFNDKWGDSMSYVLPQTSSWLAWDALESLENEVERREEARVTAKRKAELRNSATSKLSKEEFAALKEMFVPNDEEDFR